MKKIIVAVIIAIVISVISASAEFPYEFDRGAHYPMLAVVIGYEYEPDYDGRIAVVRDRHGSVWTFYDNEYEFVIGDVVNLLMYKSNPKDYTEDEILEVYYEFHMDDQSMTKWLRQTQHRDL